MRGKMLPAVITSKSKPDGEEWAMTMALSKEENIVWALGVVSPRDYRHQRNPDDDNLREGPGPR